jgi:hypothetical protein
MVRHLTITGEIQYAEVRFFKNARLVERHLSHGEWSYSDSHKLCPPYLQLELEELCQKKPLKSQHQQE